MTCIGKGYWSLLIIEYNNNDNNNNNNKYIYMFKEFTCTNFSAAPIALQRSSA